jgi:hypothetical protein
MSEAYFLSHNGLGDNLYSIGAVKLLTQFYNTVNFLCKDNYCYENCVSFFGNDPKIKCIPISTESEFQSAHNFLIQKYSVPSVDIFICGSHKSYLRSKITNKNYLEFVKKMNNTPNKYNLTYDTICESNYSFINGFYTDIGLNLNVFYEHWSLPATETSIKLYNAIEHFQKIIFVQSKCSDGRELNIKKLIQNNLNDDTIILCNDENIYDNIDDEKYKNHKMLASNYVRANILNYLKTIENASEIYIIDSCFVGIILPMLKTNKLKASIVRIILRELSNQIEL